MDSNEKSKDSRPKIFVLVEGWSSESDPVEFFVNLTDRTGEQIHNEYIDAGGYSGTSEKQFSKWAKRMGYLRAPTASEIEVYYAGDLI